MSSFRIFKLNNLKQFQSSGVTGNVSDGPEFALYISS